MKFDDKKASKNEVVLVAIDPIGSLEDVQPGAVPPQGASVSVTNAKVKFTQFRQKSRVLTGEDIRQMENTGVKNDILRQFIGNSQRLLRNEMAAAADVAIGISATRAVGTAGTTPFAKDLSPLVKARKVLRDNGTPYVDVNFVTSTDAYANILNLNVIEQAHQAGSDQERRTAVVRSQFGATKLVEDVFLQSHTAGTNSGSPVTGAALTKGTTAITFTGGGANDYYVFGDVVTFAGDTNKYMITAGPNTDTSFPTSVAAGSFVAYTPYTIESVGTTDFTAIGASANTVGVTFIASAAGSGTGTATLAGVKGASGTFYIGNPGLLKAASSAAITIGATYTPSFLLEKSSVVGLVRPPIGFDTGGYVAQSTVIQDVFGYSYNFVESQQWGQWSWFVQNAFGFAGIQSEYNTVIMG
jgi:hypothetical protein